MAKELRGKGGFWDFPIIGPMANVIYSTIADVGGVTGQAAEDVAKTTARAGVDVADTASGGLLQESLQSGLGADKAQLASMIGFGLNPNKSGKAWQAIKKIAPWLLVGGGAASQLLGESEEEYRVRMAKEEEDNLRGALKEEGKVYSKDINYDQSDYMPSDSIGVDKGLLNQSAVDTLGIEKSLQMWD